MDKIIIDALQATYSLRAWEASNESEFKHELFHQLALKELGGSSLGRPEPDAITPRLHAEGKVENGNPSKADLLLCDQKVFQDFNYKVDHIIELKRTINRAALQLELNKLNGYQGRYRGIWFVSASPITLEQSIIPAEHSKADSFHVIGPDPHRTSASVSTRQELEIPVAEVVEIVLECINDCLALYRDGKKQFQIFFWCNFEHELERHHSFPRECDCYCRAAAVPCDSMTSAIDRGDLRESVIRFPNA
jgi:hypothetical protein